MVLLITSKITQSVVETPSSFYKFANGKLWIPVCKKLVAPEALLRKLLFAQQPFAVLQELNFNHHHNDASTLSR